MTPERWARVGELFHQALALPPEARPTFVDRQAAHDTELAAWLEALLKAHRDDDGLVTGGALESWEDEPPVLAQGARVGAYEIVRELGRGGMGSVHLARRAEGGFEQLVAIKVLKRGMDSAAVLRRFRAERQILAQLDHPRIARLHDGGSTADGRPYLVMEYIDGRPLVAHAQEHSLSLAERLRLFLEICAAVEFAHRNLVVHSDVKPANVLVDAHGAPKLLDFGIAKLLRPGPGGDTTTAELRPLTPHSASPEQLAGGAITTATDVYALGLLLFELLTGRNPQAEGRPAGDLPRASTCLAQPAPRGLPGDPRRLARALRGDLEAVLARALERQPERRYTSVAALAEDVRRHLAGLPLATRRPTLAYRLGRLARRHKLGTAAVVALAAAVVVVLGQAYAVARARDRAEAQRQRSEALAGFLKDVFQVSDPRNQGASVSARELLDAAARRLTQPAPAGQRWFAGSQAQIESDPALRAHLLDAIGEVYENLGLIDAAHRTLAQAVELRRPLAGREADLDSAATLTKLAHVRRRQAAYAEAEALYRRGLALRERHLPPSSPLVAQSLNGLGLLLRVREQRAEARRHLERAIAILRAAGPEQRLTLAEALANLGALATEDRRPEEAQRLLDEARALDSERRAFADPERLRHLANQAALAAERGDLAAAEMGLREVVETRRQLLGAQHPDLAVALSNLSAVQQMRDALEPAAASVREALAIYRRHYPGAHPDVADALVNLGGILERQGHPAEAEARYREALELRRGLAGPLAPGVAACLHNIALVRAQQGDLAQAETLARQALELRRAAFGAEHTQVASSMNALAGILQQAGRPLQAERLYRHALAMRRKLHPAGHLALSWPLAGLASVLLEQGRAAEAAVHAGEALAIRRTHLAADHLERARAESLLGAAETELGRLTQAAELLDHSRTVLLSRLGPEHADVRLVERRRAALSARLARVAAR